MSDATDNRIYRTKEPNHMTQQSLETALKRGYVSHKGKKTFYYCPARLAGCSIVDNGDGLQVVPTDELTEWKQDPKPSFIERRESAAKYAEDWSNAGFNIPELARRIRALEPDAPDAAVAVSAEPMALPQWESRRVYKNAPEHETYLAARFAAPTENSFEFEGHRWRYEYTSFDDSGDFDVLGRPINTPSPPQPNPGEFDEAAERKLFEAWWHEFDPAALLGELQNCARSAWLASAKVQRGSATATLDARSADDLRAKGWSVAVHNDYRINGEPHTFWLLTHGDRAIKGEGKTDVEALNQIRRTFPVGYLDQSPEPIPAAVSEVRKELLELGQISFGGEITINVHKLRNLAAKLGGGS